jgi:hypothetical protein
MVDRTKRTIDGLHTAKSTLEFRKAGWQVKFATAKCYGYEVIFAPTFFILDIVEV